MAKLSMPINTQNDPEVNVIAEDIASALARLSWLLEGRIDYDNIAKIIDGAEERPLQIPASKVQDIPLISNEINCDKIFRDEIGTYKNTGINNSFNELLWDRLKNAVDNNPVFTVIETSISIKITKDTILYERASDINQTDDEDDKLSEGRDLFSKVLKRSLYRVKNRFIAEIPKTYVPVTYKRFTDISGVTFPSKALESIKGYSDNDYAVAYEFSVDSEIDDDSTNFVAELYQPSYTSSIGTFSTDINLLFANKYSSLFIDSDFININAKMSVLCEERI